ncbi:MAG TPA: hypothetical protein VH969_06650 [Actinophytocola sp.]|uniref:hypothetical protein n=1 Tax=Actinophytocola sp. TaxID=1872138 RepID=UPI002F933C59
MEIVFAGEQDRGAPLTWGQRHVLRNTAASPHVRIVPVPDVPVARAATAVGDLVGRHEALRTALTGADKQCAQATGTLPVELIRAGPAEARVAAEQAHELLAGPFDRAAGRPLRAALVADGAVVHHAVLVCDPAAVDHEGMDLVVNDLALLMRGALPVRTARQPVDDARQQRSEQGRRLTERAIRFWAGELDRLAPAPGYPPGERYAATMRSPAMHTAAHAIAGRHGVSTSTVYLAATAGLVGGLTRRPVAGLRTAVSNRFYPDRHDVVAAIAQDGVLVLDLGAPSFDDLVQQAWRAATRSHRFARYDPDRLADALPPLPFACFDSRPGRREVPALPAQAELRAAAERTTLTWDRAPGRDTFSVLVDGSDVTIRADHGLVPKADVECWLQALEGLLICAAYRDVATGELPALLAAKGSRPR